MENSRLKTFSSIMIAVVTILGAAAACLASIASTTAGNAQFEGFITLVKDQEAIIINHINGYEHYRAYTTYFRYTELGNELSDTTAEGNQQDISLLYNQRMEAWGLSSGLIEIFFPARYLKPDGGYDLQREIDEEYAEASLQNDLNAAFHFKIADSMSKKSVFLTSLLMIFAISFWSFTISQSIDHRSKYLFAGLGLFTALVGLLFVIAFQVIL